MEDDRQTRLEISLSHLSHVYDQLNEVVIEQGRTLRSLDALMSNLQSRLVRIERRLTDDGQADDETEGFDDLWGA